MDLKAKILEMIRLSSTDMPTDVEQALKDAVVCEEEGSPASYALKTILENIELARRMSTPVCQDTGTLLFYVDYPAGGFENVYKEAIKEAVREATEKRYLRPNSVDPITGHNTGDNLGVNTPYIHFNQWDKDEIRIRFLQKGGGCENCGVQYALPDMTIRAGRDMAGIRNAVLDAVNNAQGRGCAPGIIGVAVGGDRASSQVFAKEQLLRKVGERNPNPLVAELETKLLKEINELGIGPMGFGGKTTALDVLIGIQNRHPATFYVSISYMCWADRRKTLTIKGDEAEYA